MARDQLSDAAIRKVQPKDRPYRMSDGGGLTLLVQPDGKKWWRLRYTFQGREKMISLGIYPDTTLAIARTKADVARQLLATGADPSEVRKASKAEATRRQHTETRQALGLPDSPTFEEVAREWFKEFSPNWVKAHADRVLRRLEVDIFPWLGRRAIREIKASELLTALRRIESRGAKETAHRALQNCGQVFRYAVRTDRTERDPTADLRGALAPYRTKHLAAITDPRAVGGLLRAIDGYEGYAVVRAALRLAPLVFVRPGELRGARWADFDLDAGEWNIPAERMKMRVPHLVPLSQQAVAILRELHPLTKSSEFVFPSARSHQRPMSDNAILSALRRMGVDKEEMSGHGFRAMARTILDEVLGVRPDFIEHQLAHAVRDPNGRAYNRTAHLPERKAMMQTWADYLDKMKAGAEVVPIRGAA